MTIVVKVGPQTLYFVGMVLGVFTFGVLSDMYGRKRVLVPILLLMSLSGILTALMPNYVTFIVARVFNAFIVIAIFETYFTYMLEVYTNHSAHNKKMTKL